MILQALYEYYQRKEQMGEIAPDGFTSKKIDFFIIIDNKGQYIDVESKQIQRNKRLEGLNCIVPAIGKQSEKHSNSGYDANLLWDNTSFVFGIGNKGEIKSSSFISTIEKYYPNPPGDVSAIIHFLKSESKKQKAFANVLKHKEYGEIIQTGNPLITFRLLDSINPVIHEQHVNLCINKNLNSKDIIGNCLVTGQSNIPIALTHTATKGILGTQTSGANLVSFNKPSFNSYNKKQGQNAPVSKFVTSAYGKALKHLIDSEENKVRIGDSTTVFWAERKVQNNYDLEKQFRWFIDEPPVYNPDCGILAVKGLYESIKSGKIPIEENNRFYVLGLAPNAGRIAVRFWRVDTVTEIGNKILQHYEDFKIEHASFDSQYCTLNDILSSIAIETSDLKKSNKVYFHGKFYDVPPNLAGKVIQSILDGTPYPDTLLNLCINRIRAEVSKKDRNGKSISNVTRTRAAILKAYLNRKIRFNENNSITEVKMSLDLDNNDIGYLLGRLFSALEIIQERSAGGHGKLNSTIRDRYYGAFSSTPVTVLPILMKLKKHHIGKMDVGLQRWYEDKIMGIMDGINAKKIPSHMTMNEQAQFAIGYYHQRQDFFKSKK